MRYRSALGMLTKSFNILFDVKMGKTFHYDESAEAQPSSAPVEPIYNPQVPVQLL